MNVPSPPLPFVMLMEDVIEPPFLDIQRVQTSAHGAIGGRCVEEEEVGI
jgi:hypothetical protein